MMMRLLFSPEYSNVRFPFVAAIVSICLAFVSTASYGIPSTIQYQGRLTTASGSPVADSAWNIIFSIHSDSVTPIALWSESAIVTSSAGQIAHLLGTNTPLPATLFSDEQPRWLALAVNGEELVPRTRLSSVPYARASGHLAERDSRDSLVIVTSADSQSLEIRNDQGKSAFRVSGTLFGAITLYDKAAKPAIVLRADTTGDIAAQLPDSSVSAREILDEPAIAVDIGVNLVSLTTLAMTDILTVKLSTPADGFIILHGKCYALLSGTAGANSAIIQIDTDPGGSSQFPWYTQVGLSGYVNTQTNYFPVYVTRAYYADKGTYEFRMEGRANNFAPASASVWDPVLTAVFYPSAMDAVAATASSSAGFMNAASLPVDTLRSTDAPLFKVDLRDKLKKKQ